MIRVSIFLLSTVAYLFAVPPTPTDGTPEPLTLALLGTGGAAYAAYRKFRK